MPAELAFQHCHPCGESVDHPHLLGDLARSSVMTGRLDSGGRFPDRGWDRGLGLRHCLGRSRLKW